MHDIVSEKGSKYDYVASFLLLLYPCFKQILPISITLPLFAVGGAMFVLRHFRSNGLLLWSLALLPLAGLSLLGELVTGSINADYVAFLGGIIVFAFISADNSWAKPFVKTLVLMCSVHAFATILFFFFPAIGENVISRTSLSQYAAAQDYRSALTGSYSWNGMYTALGFVICAALALARSKGSKVYAILAVVFACALILTTKRAHLLFSIAAFIIVYFMANRERGIGKFGKFILVAGFALVMFFVVASFFPEFNSVIDRFTMQSSDNGDFLSGRTGLWAHAWEEWLSSPIVGHGWGSYSFNWIDSGTPVTSSAAHCVPLQLLAECGIIGLVIALIPFVYLLNSLGKASAQLGSMDVTSREVTLVAISFLSFFTLYATCGNPLYDSPMYIPFFAIFSIFSGCIFEISVDECSHGRNLASPRKQKLLGVSR